MELNVQGWKEFTLNRVFTLVGGFYNKKPEHSCVGNIPFLASTESNNGVTEYYCLEDIRLWDKVGEIDDTLEKKLYDGNCIAVTVNGSVCNAFYQKGRFTCSHDITALYLKEHVLNVYVGQFICAVIMQDKYRWNYGRKPHDVKKFGKSVFKFPIQHNADGSILIDNNKTYSDDGYVPDWEFMERYIKSIHSKPITTKIRVDSVSDLNIAEWEEFSVGRVFTLLNGKGITKEEIELNKGDLPAIQSGEDNNGVLGKISESYCKEMNYTMTYKQCLTVARTGSAGFVSYQGKGCVVGDSAKILLLDDDVANVYVYLFLQTMLTANRFKYDYGRKVTEAKYLDDILKLPVQRDNTRNPIIDAGKKYSDKGYIPDWQFMEKYIRSLPYSDRI